MCDAIGYGLDIIGYGIESTWDFFGDNVFRTSGKVSNLDALPLLIPIAGLISQIFKEENIYATNFTDGQWNPQQAGEEIEDNYGIRVFEEINWVKACGIVRDVTSGIVCAVASAIFAGGLFEFIALGLATALICNASRQYENIQLNKSSIIDLGAGGEDRKLTIH